MNKTKLGFTANSYATLVFGASLLASPSGAISSWLGIIPALLLAGAALLLDDNEWLRRMVAKAIAFIIAANVISTVWMLFPDVLQWIVDIISVFSKKIDLTVITKICDVFAWINTAFGIAVKALLIFYAFQAYNGKYVKVLFVENLINRNM